MGKIRENNWQLADISGFVRIGFIHWHNWGELYPLPVFFMVLISDFYGFIIPFPWGYICVSGHNRGQFAWKKSEHIVNFPKNRDPSQKHRNLLNPNWDFMKGCGSDEPRFCRSGFFVLLGRLGWALCGFLLQSLAEPDQHRIAICRRGESKRKIGGFFSEGCNLSMATM